MAVMGTFSSFTTARLAIYASQASLNVTGHNIANINTTGYTRQRMDLVSLGATGWSEYSNSYQAKIGYGVLSERVTQLRDPFLDIRYRDEQANLGAAEATLDGLNQLRNILDEVGKGEDGFGVIEAQLNEFFDRLEGLKQRVGTDEYDNLVRSAGKTLAAYLNDSAKQIETIRNNQIAKLNKSVEKVNGLLNEIRDLNEQIRAQSICGDSALELRDARNVAIDKLSSYLPIDVTYSMEKIDQNTEVEKLSISLKDTGKPPISLVDGIYATQLITNEKVARPNPAYDPTLSSSCQYIGRDGKPTDIPREAMVVKNDNVVENNGAGANKTYNADNPTLGGPYIMQPQPDSVDIITRDANGEITGTQTLDLTDPANAGVVVYTDNPAKAKVPQTFDPANPTAGGPYILQPQPTGNYTLPDGTTITLPANDANGNPIVVYTDDQNQALKLNPEYDPNNPASHKYMLSEIDPVSGKNKTTDDITLLDPDKDYIDNFNSDNPEDNRYLFQLDSLKDRKGRFMRDKYGQEIKETTDLTDTTLVGGSLQAMREFLTEEGEFSSAYDIGMDPDATTKRGLPYYQHVLDSWAVEFARAFNEANQLAPDVVYQTDDTVTTKVQVGEEPDPANPGNMVPKYEQIAYHPVKGKEGGLVQYKAITIDNNGVEITVMKEVNTHKDVLDADGNPTGKTVPKELSDYSVAELDALRQNGLLKPEYEFYDGGVLFSNRSDGNDPTGITAKNITISSGWETGAIRVLNTRKPDGLNEDGTADTHNTRQDNILHMIAMMDQKRPFNPELSVDDAQSQGSAFFKGSFQEYYTAVSATLAMDTNITNARNVNYSVTSLDLDNQRSSVSGVDLNEEATSMMQFQKSYSAACRLLTTMDSMLDKLINGTAI